MPGRGADGATVYLIDMTVTNMQDKEIEIRSYVFIGKKNRAFYDIRVTNPKGVYTKYKKYVDYSLSTVRTWKFK